MDDNVIQIEVPSTDDHGGITIPKDEYGLQPNTPYKVIVDGRQNSNH